MGCFRKAPPVWKSAAPGRIRRDLERGCRQLGGRKSGIRRLYLSTWLLTALGVLSLLVLPHSARSGNATAPDDKPFVEHRIALQLSDNDPKKESLVISVAFKLIEVYGPDKVAIEVVTLGPGIDLLKRDNANQQLVNSLVAQGVKFDVCGNTLDTIERETGKRPAINPNAAEVPAGVPALLELAEKNYTIVRP